MIDLKDTAFSLSGVTPEMFDAIKRVTRQFNRISFDKVLRGHDWVGVGPGGTSYTSEKKGTRTEISVVDILGTDRISALECGYTLYFKGDTIPEGPLDIVFASGACGHTHGLSEATVPDNLFAYKAKVDAPAIESTILAAKVGAPQVLQAALGHMQDRATTYDSAAGERSMSKTVTMFNTLYGKDLTEEQGWAMMCLLKLVRSSQGDFRLDNYEDLAAYAGLMAEGAQ